MAFRSPNKSNNLSADERRLCGFSEIALCCDIVVANLVGNLTHRNNLSDMLGIEVEHITGELVDKLPVMLPPSIDTLWLPVLCSDRESAVSMVVSVRFNQVIPECSFLLFDRRISGA